MHDGHHAVALPRNQGAFHRPGNRRGDTDIGSASILPFGLSRHKMSRQPTKADYERLLEFRTNLRRFLHWSDEQARTQHLTPAQHQLLLAIMGHPGPTAPSISDIAGYLLLQHHSAVGLVDRAEAAGLVKRERDPAHRSTVRLSLTDDGACRLSALSEPHLEEVPRLADAMGSLFVDVARQQRPGRQRRPTGTPPASA